MKQMTANDVKVPADVPEEKRKEYISNFLEMTHATGRLMLFAGDQKVEHLNDDFYGESSLGPIPEDDNEPEHLFRIASKATIGVFATQYGLISLYGRDYPSVPYLVKLNSKTHLIKTKQRDPFSNQLISVKQVAELKKNSGLKIMAVGYTLYLGSEFEHKMLAQAATIIAEAHGEGLLVVIWAYPRGKAVSDEKDPHLVAGACGVTAALGADFVKINAPQKGGIADATFLREAILAAGRTRVVCAGGSSTDARKFLKQLYEQLQVGTSGNATGRNLHQKPLDEAVRMANAISALTHDGKDVDFAVSVYEGREGEKENPPQEKKSSIRRSFNPSGLKKSSNIPLAKLSPV